MKAWPAILLFVSVSIYSATIIPSEENLRAAAATDNIVFFASSGTIKLNAPIEINGDVTIDGAGVIINIDGQEAHTLFKVSAEQRLTLRNLTLENGRNLGRNGDASLPWADHGTGGAIQIVGGSAIVERCTFRNNSAIGGKSNGQFEGGFGMGGAIFLHQAGQLVVNGCTFSGNFARGGLGGAGGGWARGGAIYAGISESVTITESEFLENSAEGGGTLGPNAGVDHALGGAIYAGHVELTVSQCTFRANYTKAGGNGAAHGGAIGFHYAALNLADSLFKENFAIGGPAVLASGQTVRIGEAGRGGAIYAAFAPLNVSGCTFDGNYTRGGLNAAQVSANPQPVGSGPALGGAIFSGSGAYITNSTLHANSALNTSQTNTASGGAVEAVGQLEMSHVTIANNVSLGPTVNVNGSAYVKAAIFGQNQGNRNFSGGILDAGFNLSADSSPAFTDPTSANNIDPKLGLLGNYGGRTPTMPILAGSPAIDRVTDNLAPLLDQRGRPRTGAYPDAGAFEWWESFRLMVQLRGPFPADTSMTYNGVVQSAHSGGRFILANIPAGDAVINITGPNTIFRPGSTNLNIQGDMTLEARAFLVHAFAWDPDFAGPTFSFAGKATEQWDFFASYNLTDWFSAGTRAFAADDVHSIPVDQFIGSFFLKAIRR